MPDFGVQCFFFEAITHRSVATQTDVRKASPCEIDSNKSGIGISYPVKTEKNSQQHPKNAEWKVSHDHNYIMNATPKVIFPTYNDQSFKTTPLPPVHDITCNQCESTDAVDTGHESDVDDETTDNDKDDEDMDPSCKLSDAEQFLSDHDMEVEPSEDESQESPPHRETKFLVFGSCLNGLLKRAQNVGMLSSSRRTKPLVV